LSASWPWARFLSKTKTAKAETGDNGRKSFKICSYRNYFEEYGNAASTYLSKLLS
jgi:hypothetical protein